MEFGFIKIILYINLRKQIECYDIVYYFKDSIWIIYGELIKLY